MCLSRIFCNFFCCLLEFTRSFKTNWIIIRPPLMPNLGNGKFLVPNYTALNSSGTSGENDEDIYPLCSPVVAGDVRYFLFCVCCYGANHHVYLPGQTAR